MITIKKPFICAQGGGGGGKSRLSVEIDVDGKIYPLWYEVDEKYGQYLCSERSDAFVVGVSFVAIKYHHDISFEAPMSWELKESLEKDFFSVLSQHQPGLYVPKLIGDVAPQLRKNKVVIGTGISCGVDCLYTVKRRMSSGLYDGRYLLLNNMHGAVNNDSEEKQKFRFNYLIKRALKFSRDSTIPVIIGNTNYNNLNP